MATFRKRLGKWEVRVRRYSNATLSKTFLEKADADKWAREVEVKIEKGLYEDLSQANTITLRELLQTYFKDFWKYLRRNFVVSFHYLSDFLFWFFVKEKA